MTSHIPEELSTRIDWSPFAIMGKTMPPRDPDDDEVLLPVLEGALDDARIAAGPVGDRRFRYRRSVHFGRLDIRNGRLSWRVVIGMPGLRRYERVECSV